MNTFLPTTQHYSPHATLAAIGARIRSLKIFMRIRGLPLHVLFDLDFSLKRDFNFFVFDRSRFRENQIVLRVVDFHCLFQHFNFSFRWSEWLPPC
jgi:hypothetical protein